MAAAGRPHRGLHPGTSLPPRTPGSSACKAAVRLFLHLQESIIQHKPASSEQLLGIFELICCYPSWIASCICAPCPCRQQIQQPASDHQKQQDQQQQLQLQPHQQQQPQNGRSWRHRLRHLLCCVAPPPQGPGCSAADLQLVNTLYQLPPQPPRVYREPVIGPKHPEDLHKKTLVLDLDETLVHSSFKPIPNPDYIIPVEIDGRLVDVYVLKRPWLDHFLNAVSCFPHSSCGSLALRMRSSSDSSMQ